MRSSWYILSDSSRVVARVAAASSETIEKSAADAFWAADDIVVERKMAQFRVEEESSKELISVQRYRDAGGRLCVEAG